MTGWPDGYGRFVRDEVTSTFEAAGELLSDTPAPFWVLAHQQTAARGRRGRHWAMPKGNFAATLVLRPDEPPGVMALRSFVMSLALFQTCVQVSAQPDAFAVKWPNDVLMQGGKVAGILLESGGMGTLAIGVGVNLAAAPDSAQLEAGAVRPVSLAGDLGCQIDPETFLNLLAQAYALAEQQFQSFGFAPIRAAWLAHAARLGQVITARTGREEFVGTFEDVDADGNLMLRTPLGLRAITAADVYF